MNEHGRHDSDISEDGRAYIQSLRSASARDDARDYARMEGMSFQARIGPAIDDHDALLNAHDALIETMKADLASAKDDIAELLKIVKNKPGTGGGPLTRAAMWIEESTPRLLSTIGAVGFVIVAYIMEQTSK
ncbi:MAG: hypothetical protein WC211_03670 [Dehalococcoidia bacterium]